jgi:type I restriction enzyme, S subunit
LLLVTRTSVGKVAIAGIDLCFSQDITGIVPDRTMAHPGYLVHLLRTKQPHFERVARGATIKGITRQVVADILVPLPSLPEQRRIAELLDRADALRGQRRAALAEVESLIEAVFFDMFGDPAANPKKWPRRSLGELMSFGPQNGLYKPASDYGSGIPILRIDAFYDGMVTNLDSLKRVRLSDNERDLYCLKPGEIVVNRVNSREYLGKSALMPPFREPTVFESNMMRFDVDRGALDPVYVVQFLQTAFVKGQILRASKDAVNQSSINQQDVRGLSINLPPLARQREFSTKVDAISRLKASQEGALAALDALFASLEHRAFRREFEPLQESPPNHALP